MASITKTIDTQGNTVYKVQASGGRGRRVKRSWRPEPGWSAKTIERELNKLSFNVTKFAKSSLNSLLIPLGIIALVCLDFSKFIDVKFQPSLCKGRWRAERVTEEL